MAMNPVTFPPSSAVFLSYCLLFKPFFLIESCILQEGAHPAWPNIRPYSFQRSVRHITLLPNVSRQRPVTLGVPEV